MRALPAVLLLITLTASLIAAPAPPSRVTDGAYTAAQADRGQALYRKHCTYCHHDDLLGGEDLKVVPPALVGLAFSERWVGKSLRDLFTTLATTMPWERAKLPPAAYADIVAYLLQENGYPAGAEELPAMPERLAEVAVVPAR